MVLSLIRAEVPNNSNNLSKNLASISHNESAVYGKYLLWGGIKLRTNSKCHLL